MGVNFMVEDDPNPKAIVGFFCRSPFHYYVSKNIYRHLPAAEFIIGERRYKNNALHIDSNERLAAFLSQNGVHWRYYDSEAPQQMRKKFFEQYKVIVTPMNLSTAFNDISELVKNKLKVRVLYGNAKDLYNFGLWNADFDLILAYGPYSQKFLETYTRAVAVGNPKFDDWFSGSLDRNFIGSLRKKLDPAKKTVLYLPTHTIEEPLSSFHAAIKELENIEKDFNVLVKLHYLISFDEQESVEKLRASGHLIFDENDDILPLLKIADIVVSDNSGAIFDAILADKDIILFETDKKVFDHQVYPSPRAWAGQASTTYQESLEQRVKEKDLAIGPLIQSFADMPRAVKELEQRTAEFRKNRLTVKNMVFGYQDTDCGKRAADAITSLLNAPQPQQYPFIYRVRQRENLIRYAAKKLRKNLPFLEKIRMIYYEYFE